MHLRSRLRLPALVCAFLPLAACAGAPRPAELEPRLAAAAWDSSTPPEEIARWIERQCGGGGADTRRVCVEKSLYATLDRGGIAMAMGTLDRLVESSAWARSDAHGYAHGLGIAAYRSPETVGRTFAACTPSQSSGCFHGVIQGYFLAMKRDHGGMTPRALNALCEEHRASSFLFYQCTHGLGHGVMALADHHLPRSLELCDQVTDATVRESCYGGAFMENVVGVTHPHNMAEAHAGVMGGDGHDSHGGGGQGHGGHAEHATTGDTTAMAGHAHHAGHGQGAAGGEGWKALDPENLHHPCTAVADKYRPACYHNQGAAMLTLTGGDVDRVARECAAAPEPQANARACFESLGRNLLPRDGWNPAKTMALCARAPEPGRGWCGMGVATTMTNRSADARDGLRVCALMGGGEIKTECYRTLGWMLTSTERDPARREAACAAVEPAFAAACRTGAGLATREE